MSHIKFLISLIIGIAIYTVFSVVAGQNGILAYRQLYEQKLALTEHVSELNAINESLVTDYRALQSDRATIESFAKKLGLVEDGQFLVKINGLSEQELRVYDTGTVMRIEPVTYIDERSCKIAGIAGFFVSLMLFLIQSLSVYARNSRLAKETI